MSPEKAVRPAASPGSGSAARPPAAAIPDIRLPLAFLLTGILSLVLATAMLALRPGLLAAYHYNQEIIAITHLLVLGFLLSVISGALYQLVPVVLETRLHSERLARLHYGVHLISVAGMVVMFWRWDMKQVGHFGSGLAFGVGLLAWNLGRTLVQARRWNPVSFGVTSAIVWLVAVIGAGLALAAAKSTYELTGRTDVQPMLAVTLAGLEAVQTFLARFEPLAVMHAHAHLGLLGVFVLLTCAVAFRLVPMFLLGEIQSPRRAWAALGCLNAGTLAVFLTVLTQSPLKPAAGLLVLAGVTLYLGELRAIVRARRRLNLDWGIRMFLFSQALLLPTAALGLALSLPGQPLTEFIGRLETAYGFLAILGVVGLAILGMLYKIIPFLVWFASYNHAIGRFRTPALHDMYSHGLQAWGAGLWVAGLVTSLAAILLGSPAPARLGAFLLLLSLASFALNVARILRHFFRPRLQPLNAPQLTSTPRTP